MPQFLVHVKMPDPDGITFERTYVSEETDSGYAKEMALHALCEEMDQLHKMSPFFVAQNWKPTVWVPEQDAPAAPGDNAMKMRVGMAKEHIERALSQLEKI